MPPWAWAWKSWVLEQDLRNRTGTLWEGGCRALHCAGGSSMMEASRAAEPVDR